MFASAQTRMMALAVSVAFALTTAPAKGQAPAHEDVGLPRTAPPLENSEAREQAPAHEDVGLPMTAPPLENSESLHWTAPTAHPSDSDGLGVFAALIGPLGLALGGLATASAGLTTVEAPRVQPSALR